jgi:PAS domain S-box-containing protein
MVESRRDIILILEDDAGVARLQQRRLERAGYAVINAATPDEALGHLRRGGISLIVLDYHLGGEMTGLEFCARLKAMGYDLPIVMVSGTGSESIIIQALRVGVREFIPKTKDFLEDLPQAIGKVLERTQLEMQLTGSAQNIGTGGLVLIVEDDPATALLHRRQLERAGYVVVTATNAREAIQQVTQGEIALMLLDQHLAGDETGLDVYRHLKSIGHDLPTIMVTGFSDETIAIEALRAGVRDFVVKTTDYLDYLPKAVEEVFARVALESQILESRARLASIIGSALDAIITVEADLHITMFNAAAEKIFGCEAAESIGQSIHRFLRDFPVAQATGTEAAGAEHEAARSPLRYETMGVCADGRECPLEISVVQSELIGRTFYTITARDISERKQAEREREQLLANERALRAQAEQASRLKDEFLATVSHELRTPLNSMLGWTRLMRTGNLDAKEMVRAVETVERNAVAQTKLVNDLLDMSRIVSGKFQLNLEPVMLSTIIEAAVEVLRPTAEAKQVQTQTAFDRGIGLLLADPTRLQQIVWNLLSNAIKFTPEGGHIGITLRRAGSEAQIAVRDSGIGIGADFLPHVFDPFRQADGSISRRQGGLGLGLAIVRHLVELHGGQIEAASPGPGLGSTFTVRLPLQETRAQNTEPVFEDSAAKSLRHRSQSGLLAGLRILIVDDQDDARELIEVLLTQYGAEVSAAGSAQEALDMFDQIPFDLLVSDIGMPGKDGYWLIDQVRRRGEHGKQIPAIALTAYASKEDRIHILAAGYHMHVPKPVEPDELATVAASLAGRMGRNA